MGPAPHHELHQTLGTLISITPKLTRERQACDFDGSGGQHRPGGGFHRRSRRDDVVDQQHVEVLQATGRCIAREYIRDILPTGVRIETNLRRRIDLAPQVAGDFDSKPVPERLRENSRLIISALPLPPGEEWNWHHQVGSR